MILLPYVDFGLTNIIWRIRQKKKRKNNSGIKVTENMDESNLYQMVTFTFYINRGMSLVLFICTNIPNTDQKQNE